MAMVEREPEARQKFARGNEVYHGTWGLPRVLRETALSGQPKLSAANQQRAGGKLRWLTGEGGGEGGGGEGGGGRGRGEGVGQTV